MNRNPPPIFRSAISDDRGEVDVGYLALMWGLIGWLTSTAALLLVGGVSAWRDQLHSAEIITSMGLAFGAVSGGFATMLGAVGLFRMGDKQRASDSTTTTTQERTVVRTKTPSKTTLESVSSAYPGGHDVTPRGTAEKTLHVAVESFPTNPDEPESKP